MARLPIVLTPLGWTWHRVRVSPRAQSAVLLLMAAAVTLVLWQVAVVWRNLGFGLTVAAPGVAILLAAFRLYSRPMAKRWSTWIGMTAAVFLAWGILAFFNGSSGPLVDTSLGGRFGDRIIGDRDILGVLRLVGVALVATAFIGPKPSWRTTKIVAPRVGKSLFRLDLAACQAAYITASTPVRWAIAQWLKVAPRVSRLAVSSWRGMSGRRRKAAANTAGTHPAAVAEQSPPVEQAVVERAPTVPAPSVEPPPDAWFDDGAPPDESELALLEEDVELIDDVDLPDSEPQPVAPDPFLQSAASPEGWRLPSLDVLDTAETTAYSGVDNTSRARAIEESLSSYGIQASVVEIHPGPAVTQFGVEPGWLRKFKEVKLKDDAGRPVLDEEGNQVIRKEEISRTRVKVDAIANLDKDLAMALAAPSIRIEAPIPGKSLVGIEVPNNHFETVAMRSALDSPAFEALKAKSKLAVVLGKGSGGDIEAADLGKMPHLLVAGATGSGKSICLRSILVSLLMNTTPKELRLVLIDPKRVELVTFNSVPHLLGEVIVEVEQVVGVLRWAIQEMDERYKKFSSVGARNLEGYNKHRLVAEPLPYLVIVIDELADLMMAAPYDVEHSITRLAQLGRATGIHLIVATQRPSVDVVTGLIKANFPTRMSFAVSSLIDSRTILDTGGAEKLLGRGDMLYLPQDAPKPKRIQGVFISDAETERVVRAWNMQRSTSGPTQFLPDLTAVSRGTGETSGAGGSTQALTELAEGLKATAQKAAKADNAKPSTTASPPKSAKVARSSPQREDRDPMMPQARQMADEHVKLSPSLLQRRLKIGYTKAEKLLEFLREEGYGEAEEDDEA